MTLGDLAEFAGGTAATDPLSELTCYPSRGMLGVFTIGAVFLSGLLLGCEQSDTPRASTSGAPGPDARAKLVADRERSADATAANSDMSASALNPTGAAGAAATHASSVRGPDAFRALQVALGEIEDPLPLGADDSDPWNNCLEPLRVEHSQYDVVHQAVGFPPPDALAVMVFTPILADQPRVFSLHKSSDGEFYTRVVRMDPTPSERTRYERRLDTKTARVLERLWFALLARTRSEVVHIGGCCMGLGCGPVELMLGKRAGASAGPLEPGSTVHLATDSAMALARLTEHPEPGDEKEFVQIQKRLRLALDRALKEASCESAPTRSVGQNRR